MSLNRHLAFEFTSLGFTSLGGYYPLQNADQVPSGTSAYKWTLCPAAQHPHPSQVPFLTSDARFQPL